MWLGACLSWLASFWWHHTALLGEGRRKPFFCWDFGKMTEEIARNKRVSMHMLSTQ